MDGDGLIFLQFADRLGLNLFAVLSIGFALHAALGVVERDSFGKLRWAILAASAATALFVVLRFLILLAQMGDGTTLDFELASLAWAALGNSSVFIVAGVLIAAAGVWLRLRALALIGGSAASVGFGLTGHTQGLADPGLAPLAVGLHVLIAGLWIAAPISLYPSTRIDDATLLARLRRFSALAVAAIPVLVALGVWLALLLAGGWPNLYGSAYGQLLLGKLAIGAVGVAIGALNKQVLTKRLASSPSAGRKLLKLTLGAEAVLFATAIILVSAATTFAGPAE